MKSSRIELGLFAIVIGVLLQVFGNFSFDTYGIKPSFNLPVVVIGGLFATGGVMLICIAAHSLRSSEKRSVAVPQTGGNSGPAAARSRE